MGDIHTCMHCHCLTVVVECTVVASLSLQKVYNFRTCHIQYYVYVEIENPFQIINTVSFNKFNFDHVCTSLSNLRVCLALQFQYEIAEELLFPVESSCMPNATQDKDTDRVVFSSCSAVFILLSLHV